jgi:hypothetical protein
MMLDSLMKENSIDLQPDEIAFIKDLIHGEKKHSKEQYVVVYFICTVFNFIFQLAARKRLPFRNCSKQAKWYRR